MGLDHRVFRRGGLRFLAGLTAAGALLALGLLCTAAALVFYAALVAEAGEGGLNADPSDQFHVGATKILHWIAPSLFVMVDANVAKAFREHHRVDYRKSTQPGYTAKKYVDCLRHAQDEIRSSGFEKFVRIEPATPLARLFDKAAWVAGQSTQLGIDDRRHRG